MPRKSRRAKNSTAAKTAIIRQRGQITIPDAIRQSASWIIENQPVTISLTSDNELRICPVQQSLNWQDLQREIKKVRSLPGKHIDTTKFITDDRQQH